jgi:hypothetical protein
MSTNCNIEVFGQQINLPACHVLDELDPWVRLNEAHEYFPKCELSRTDCCRKSHSPERFLHSLPHERFSFACGSHHARGMSIELLAGRGWREMA